MKSERRINDALAGSRDIMSAGEPSLLLNALQSRVAEAMPGRGETIADLADAAQRIRILESTIETVPVGVVVAAVPSGRIILANRLIVEMTGHPVLYSQDIEAYAGWVAYHDDGSRVQPDQWPMARVIRDNVDQADLDFHYERGDGTRRWLRAFARPIRDGEGTMIGAAVAMIDIDAERHQGDTQRIMIGELNHRAKNMIAVIKSIVSQTLHRADVDAAIIDKVGDRLEAYARAHGQMTALPGHAADVGTVAQEALRGAIDEGRIHVSGPACAIPDRTAVALSMALHELATNAVKHGALASADGRVDLDWSIKLVGERRELVMRWQESGGVAPVPPDPNAQAGFGSIIIDRALTMQARGKVTISYPRRGLVWRFTAPLPAPPS